MLNFCLKRRTRAQKTDWQWSLYPAIKKFIFLLKTDSHIRIFMTNKEKSIAFSNGEFDKVYDFIADKAEWTVVEENTFIGKPAASA